MRARVRKHVSSQEITITHTSACYSLITIYRGAGDNFLFIAKKTLRWPSSFSSFSSSLFFKPLPPPAIYKIELVSTFESILKLYLQFYQWRKVAEKKFITRMKFRISQWSDFPSFSHLIHPFSSNLRIVAYGGSTGMREKRIEEMT